ncbi:MAG: exo-alpha-sialidase, partial [Chloroflexi bacterium]|nr:exo-alpha-sialidase [Chloroflexota bacterium]
MKRIIFPMLLFVGLAYAATGLRAVYAAQGVSHDWGPEFQVNNTSGPASGVVGRGLVVDSQNQLHATWTDRSSGKMRAYFASSVDNGHTWSNAIDFSLSALPAFGPNIAIGPDDILHVAWLDRIDAESRIYHSRSLDGGVSWETPKAVSAESEIDAVAITISVDTSKRVHLSWHAGNPNSETEIAQVYYARSLDNGKTFQEPLKLNTDADAHAAFPRFDVQGSNGELVAVSWRDRRAGNWDIYVAVSTDAGESFQEYFVYAAPGARYDYDPEVIVDPNGVLHLAFFSNQRGGSVIIYQYSTDLGQTWSKVKV